MRRNTYSVTSLALAAAAGLAGITACSGGSGMGGIGGDSATSSADVFVNVAGASGLKPDHPVVVSSETQPLTRVFVAPVGGHKIAGHFSEQRHRWQSTDPLALATTYSIAVSAGQGSDEQTFASNFRTFKPRYTYAAHVAPLAGETVGVGMPIAVYFTKPVHKRAAVEKRFHVTSSAGVTGAWHWYSDTEMHYRPQQFWPANSNVSLTYDLRGLNAGHNTWSDDARTIPFSIGDAHVSKVDAKTHYMKVYSNGTLLHTYPVSTGRDTLPSSSGIHVVSEKNADQIMDSSTIGIPINSPDGYYEHVPWSVRISNSGEFVHAAPWSVADQGHRNVSHGCVNMAPADAEWFFNFTRRGDIVEITGTSRQLEQGNGFADWNLSWSDWLAGDALKS